MGIAQQFSILDRVLLTASAMAITWSVLGMNSPDTPVVPVVAASCTSALRTAVDDIPGVDGSAVKRLPPCAPIPQASIPK